MKQQIAAKPTHFLSVIEHPPFIWSFLYGRIVPSEGFDEEKNQSAKQRD
jgi:hypothetical protein